MPLLAIVPIPLSTDALLTLASVVAKEKTRV